MSSARLRRTDSSEPVFFTRSYMVPSCPFFGSTTWRKNELRAPSAHGQSFSLSYMVLLPFLGARLPLTPKLEATRGSRPADVSRESSDDCQCHDDIARASWPKQRHAHRGSRGQRLCTRRQASVGKILRVKETNSPFRHLGRGRAARLCPSNNVCTMAGTRGRAQWPQRPTRAGPPPWPGPLQPRARSARLLPQRQSWAPWVLEQPDAGIRALRWA